MPQVAEDSPLRRRPAELSEKQILLLDCIRYSADMASIGHERLWRKLCYIDTRPDNEATTYDIAEAMLDAWSVVDAAHRFLDAIANFPGLRNSTWRELATRRLKEADRFRNSWQHLTGNETLQTTLDARGQAWGSIGWVKHHEGRPKTWFVAIAGTILKGTESLFIGPHHSVDRVDSRRIRLFHGDDEFYLTRAVNDIFIAVAGLEDDLRSGRVTLRGDQIDQDRGSDIIYEGYIEVIHAFVEDRHAEAETQDSKGISQQ